MTNFGRTASDYGRHRAGFPPVFFDRLAAHGVLSEGRSALDLGTGTGTLARGLAERGMAVTGVDVAGSMVKQAHQIAVEMKLDIDFRCAPAEKTGLEDERFDLLTAGQCWHWFQRPTVARESVRLLRAGGHIVIAHLDWLAFSDNVVDMTVKTILDFGARFAPQLEFGQNGIYPQWTTDVREAGFEGIETFSFDIDLDYRREDWRGRVRASGPIGASLPPAKVAEFDELFRTRLERFADPLSVPHRVWALIARKPASSIR